MTTAVLTTSDLIGSTGSVTETGGVAETTLDDGSDATGLTLVNTSTTGFQASLSLGTFTLGTGRLKSWFVTYRRASTAGVGVGLTTSIGTEVANDFGLMPQIFETVTTTAYSNPPVTVVSAAQVPPAYTQAMIDAMSVTFYADPATGGTVLVTEMSVSVTFAVAPVANITYPTGSPALTTTSTLAATWTHAAGSDGGGQAAFEWKVFSAAQYGAGGFSPDTSTPTLTSGVVPSNSAAASVLNLPNSTTYKFYLRTAQSINGSLHWSPWDSEIFSTNSTPATVSSITTVANTLAGSIAVTVNHAGQAWVDVEVERTDDGGTTWIPVRGATKVTATNTHVTAWSSSLITVIDMEAPNGVTVTYRARASTALITGPWTSSSATSWTGVERIVYLKDPHDPTLNITLEVEEFPQPTRPIPQGIFELIGAELPNVVSDVRRGRVGSFVAQTSSRLAGDTLDNASASPFKLLQFPASHRWGSKYIALGDVQEITMDPAIDVQYRSWRIAFVQIDRPADHTDY